MLVRLTGLSPYLVDQCSEDFQLRVKGLGAKLLFTATVSAAIMALALSMVIFEQWLVFPLIFSLAFGVYFFFDRLVITGRPGGALMAMRLLAIIVMPLLNTLLLDTLAFRRDIRQAFEKNRSLEKAKISDTAQAMVSQHQQRIETYRRERSALRDSIATMGYILMGESDGSSGSGRVGTGDILDYKAKQVEEMKRIRQRGIEDLDLAIQAEEMAIVRLRQEAAAQIEALPTWSAVGLLGHIEWLHVLLIKQKNAALILFTCCWLVFFAILEALPLLGRSLCDFSEYEQCRAARATERTQRFIQQLKHEAELYLQQLVLEYQRALNKTRAATQTAKACGALDEIMQMFQVEMDTIIALANEEERIDQQLSGQYRQHASMALHRALGRIRAWQHDEEKLAA